MPSSAAIARRTILVASGVGVTLVVSLMVRFATSPAFSVAVSGESNSDSYTLVAPTVDDVGDAVEETSEIYLLDTDGKIAHTWTVLGAVQLAKLKPDGNLLYSTRDRSFIKRAGIREVDPFGNVLWYYPCWADHDFELLDNGNLLIHYIEDVPAPAIGPGLVRCPRLVEVTRDQQVVWEWRAEDHLAELTDLAGLTFPLEPSGQEPFDWAHNNTCGVIGPNSRYPSDPRFKPGNILFSYRELNTIGVIDRSTREIVWTWGGAVLDGQHNPRLLENGNIMIFDNGAKRGYSRVVEVDPSTEEIVWEYSDTQTKRATFFSGFQGNAHSLPNGNIFVCQSGRDMSSPAMLLFRGLCFLRGEEAISSRLFEVEPSGEIAWECIITGRGKNTYAIYQAAQYPKSYVQPLFDAYQGAEDMHLVRSLPYI